MKKYQTVKVKDPITEGHSVRLHPRQSFVIVLTKVDDNDDYNIGIKSRFLVLEDVVVDDKKGQITFKIGQKYDLNEWANISCLFLGNVVINRTNAPEGKGKLHLCVFLDAHDNSKGEVLTVINPWDQLVKIEPCQLLHMVTFDEEYPRWTIVTIDGLNCAKTETVYNDHVHVYDKDHLFCQAPRSVDMPINNDLSLTVRDDIYQREYVNAPQRETGKEYHFWMNLNAEALRKAHNAANGNYELGRIKFKGRTMEDNDDCKEHQVLLMMTLRGSKRRLNLDQYHAVKFCSENWNQRHYDKYRSSIINPLLSETVEVLVDNDDIYVEIPQPLTYFGNAFDEKIFWRPDLDIDCAISLDIKVRELGMRHVNGVGVQRFAISNIIKNMPPGDLSFIGAIRFVCNRTIDDDEDIRMIALVLWKVKKFSENIKLTSAVSKHSYSSSSGSPRSNYYYSSPSRRDVVKQDNGRYYEEIEVEQKSFGSLIECASYTQLSRIGRKLSKKCDYYDDDYGYGDYPNYSCQIVNREDVSVKKKAGPPSVVRRGSITETEISSNESGEEAAQARGTQEPKKIGWRIPMYPPDDDTDWFQLQGLA